jgi:hypothetical protein
MTQQQFKRKKISEICTLESYEWLQEYFNQNNPLPYKMTVENHLRVKTNDRFYFSKVMEKILTIICKNEGADPIKAPDKGMKIKSKGKDIFIKVKGVKVGRADVKCFIFGKMFNFEVKAKADRMSEEQKIEQQRAEMNGEYFLIIRTIDDIVNWYMTNKL